MKFDGKLNNWKFHKKSPRVLEEIKLIFKLVKFRRDQQVVDLAWMRHECEWGWCHFYLRQAGEGCENFMTLKSRPKALHSNVMELFTAPRLFLFSSHLASYLLAKKEEDPSSRLEAHVLVKERNFFLFAFVTQVVYALDFHQHEPPKGEYEWQNN